MPVEERFMIAPIIMALMTAICVSAWLKYTARGFALKFAGERPEALEAAGISVIRVRFLSVVAAGVLAGWGGASLSIFLSSSFSREMTAGRGFMALAALILGKWNPSGALMGCIFFGFVEAIQIRFQGASAFGLERVPVQFIQVVPYVVTLIVLAGIVGRARAPKYLGQPYIKAKG